MELPPAYEAVQLEVERRLHRYLQTSAEDIKQIIIVGANDGSEIQRLRLSYPQSRFLCFEPSPEWQRVLKSRFRECDFVKARDLALGASCGKSKFYELPLAGNGSLLSPDADAWSRFNRIDDKRIVTFEVEVSTLDKEAAGLHLIDLLWIDVQGAEGQVLAGAINTLERVSAVFLEVAMVDSPYRGAVLFPELDSLLKKQEFQCVGIGLDPWNYSGNAFWIRNPASRILFNR